MVREMRFPRNIVLLKQTQTSQISEYPATMRAFSKLDLASENKAVIELDTDPVITTGFARFSNIKER